MPIAEPATAKRPAVVLVARDARVGRGRARDEAALRLVAQHRDEFGAIIGFGTQRLVRDGDRGQRHSGRRDLVEHLLREGDAVERVLCGVAVVDRDFGPAQPALGARNRGEDVRAERLVGILDRDRVFLAELVQLAAVRPLLVRVAPYIKLPRRAADEDRDRLARELRGLGGAGGLGAAGFGRLGRRFRGRQRILFRLHAGLGGVELRAQRLGPGGRVLFCLLRRVCLAGLSRIIADGSENLVGVRQVGVGARLESFQVAHRCRRRGRIVLCRRERRLRGGGRPCGIVCVLGQRRGACRHGVDHVLLRHEQRRIGKRDRLRVGRRDDHPHPHRRLVEDLLGEIERHAHAAVRGRVAGQRAAVQRDTVPGDAQHVRHPGIVVHAGVVILVLLDDGEDAGGRLASGRAGRYRGAQDPAVGVIEGHVLALDRHDRHDRFCRRALGRRLGRAFRPRRPGGGRRRRDQSRRRGRGHEHHEGGRPAPERSVRADESRRRLRSGHCIAWLKRITRTMPNFRLRRRVDGNEPRSTPIAETSDCPQAVPVGPNPQQ